MRLRTWITAGVGAALSLAAATIGLGRQSGPELKVGDAAPPFNLRGSDDATHRLADHLGTRAVVLAWFPKAFTGG